MNTPAHLLIGGAAFARPAVRFTALAAFLGALAPDISLYLMTFWSIAVMDISPRIVFDELYFSDAWMQVFAIDNSFIFWGLGLGFGLWSRRAWVIAFCGAALLHLLCDFPLHHDDSRPHFWPVTDWRFESPVSYWDRSHGARWISPLEGAIAAAAAVILIIRFKTLPMRLFAIVLLVAELWVVRAVFTMIF